MLIPRIVDVDRLVADSHAMLRRMIGEDIELRIASGQNLWAVKADPNQLQQVIMNLVVNARDAMPQGGTLWIETANAEVDAAMVLAHPWMTPGSYVQLSVRDSGTGMDENVRAHLFEPFFTTKPVGKGTGLGLATVYGIVKQSGGHVLVDSAPGAGSTFRIYLPRTEGGERAVESEWSEPAVVGGTETVLVVEDDPRVREAARRVLAARGYTVLEAEDGMSALEMVATHGKPDLLLTDVVMPGMSGLQLARVLLLRFPTLKVICASGYAADVTDLRGGLPPGVPLLQKPYTSTSLALAVRRSLDGLANA
jgi:CheY-like chemotaxis protein